VQWTRTVGYSGASAKRFVASLEESGCDVGRKTVYANINAPGFGLDRRGSR